MKRNWKYLAVFALAALILSGCSWRTVNQMYSLPKRSAEYDDLQKAIDSAMIDLEYSAPLSGENQQTVQMADLDGDGVDEYLLFAKGVSDKPMKILIFSRSEESCQLETIIDSYGSAFDQVEYTDIDGEPGVELVFGCRISDQVQKSLAVSSFTGGAEERLLNTNYYKFVTSDLDSDGLTELMVINPGDTATDKAVAALYSYGDGAMDRSREVRLSETADNITRIMVGNLHGGIPAVYVAGAVEESAIITDIFAMENGRFTNVSLSNESGTSIQTLRNYYVYADDIDNDGVLELPSLITMVPIAERSEATEQYLIRWYAMDIVGREINKMHTFHNMDGGWYLQLDEAWASRVTVSQEGGTYTFYVWDESFENTGMLVRIHALTGSDREEMAVQNDRIVLYRAEGVVYAAELGPDSGDYGVTRENLADWFHLIHRDWKTGET